MKTDSKRKLLFVINPQSGGDGKNDMESTISGLSKDYDYEWKIYYTSGENDKSLIEEEIRNYDPEMLVSVGGDGTVNLVASMILHRDIGMGIIPAGSANGLAHNLDIPNKPDAALEKCLHAEAQPVDVIRINDRYNCIHLSDIGINARIVKRFEEEGAAGLIGYGKQLFKEFFSPSSAFKFKVSYDHSDYNMRAEMVVVANARAFGTGAVINPKGDIDDGKFEIIIIKPYPWWFVFRLFAGFLTGNFSKMKYVDVLSLEHARIELKKPAEMQIDGEIMESLKSIDIKMIPGAVKIHY